jgi:transcriptional regulator with XRE-family HTH domain
MGQSEHPADAALGDSGLPGRVSRHVSFGPILRRLRTARRMTQLDLAVSAGSSIRHLSFLETGRALPSRAMIVRLSGALALSRDEDAELYAAAGYAVPGGAVQPPSLADRAFGTAAAIGDSREPAEAAAHARALLGDLGIDRYFVARVAVDRRGRPALTVEDLSAFPSSWLQSYDAERYAAVDPLLPAALGRPAGFFWDEAFDRRALTGLARTMFDAAADGGVRDGFVQPAPQRDGSVRLVSMMGAGGVQGKVERQALQLVARALLDRPMATIARAADQGGTLLPK